MTRSGVPSARVAVDWPIDSRITLPPPNTPRRRRRSGPRSTSMSRSVSARRMRSPVVGPYSAAVAVASIELIGDSVRAASSGPATSPRRPATMRSPPSGTRSTSRVDARLEAHRRAGRDVQPVTRGPRRGRTAAPGWPRRSGSASRPGPAGRRCSRRSASMHRPPGVELDRLVGPEDLARDHRGPRRSSRSARAA